MSEHLSEAVNRESRAAAKVARTDSRKYLLAGTELAREVATAVRLETRSMPISEPEREAVTQATLARIYGRPLRGRPRDVLRFIDRAERMPTIAAREREQIERNRTGRNHLRLIVKRDVLPSRDWRDTADTYRVRDRADRKQSEDRARTEVVAAETHGDYLSAAVARESIAAGDHLPMAAPIAGDLQELARALADAEPGTDRERAAMEAAMLARLPDAEGAVPDAKRLALALGCTYGTLRNRLTEGGRLWRDRYPDRSDLAARVREVAEREQLTGRDRERTGPVLPVPALAAQVWAEGAQVEAARVAAVYLQGGRGDYSPATVRALVRNLRAPSGRPTLQAARRVVTYSGRKLAGKRLDNTPTECGCGPCQNPARFKGKCWGAESRALCTVR